MTLYSQASYGCLDRQIINTGSQPGAKTRSSTMASHEDDDNPIVDFEHGSKLWEILEGRLQDVTQKLDGKWEKRFDEIESLLRTSLKRKLKFWRHERDESESRTTPKQNELDYDERDVLVLQEDEAELDLQQCEKALIEGQGSSASTTEKDKGQLFDEIDLEFSSGANM